MTQTTFTRQQVDSIKVGTKLAKGFDGVHFGEAREVVSIHAKQDDVSGKLFVCGYTTFGENAQISFSIKEGDALDYRLYRIEE